MNLSANSESMTASTLKERVLVVTVKTVLRKEQVLGVQMTEISSKHQGLRAQSGHSPC